MKPSENILSQTKTPHQIITLGYAERPKKMIFNEQTSQLNIKQPKTGKENCRSMVQQNIDACKGKSTKSVYYPAGKRLPLDMIVSKTATRKRVGEPSSSDEQSEESMHPAERIFKSMEDPNKYKLKPPYCTSRPCRNPRQPDKMGEIVNLMKEKCSQFDFYPRRGQPDVKTGSDPELRNIVSSVLTNKSNLSRLDGNFYEVNYNNYKALYETTRLTKSKRLRVLDEDPLGPGSTVNCRSSHPAVTSIQCQTPQQETAKSRGCQSPWKETLSSTGCQSPRQETATSRGCQSPWQEMTTSRGVQSSSIQDLTRCGQTDSSDHFRFNPSLKRFRSSSQMQWLETQNYQDEFLGQVGSSFTTSTPFRVDPPMGSPGFPSCQNYSSTSSGETIAEERLLVTYYPGRREESPDNKYISFSCPSRDNTGSMNSENKISSIFIKSKTPSILKFLEE